MKSNHQTEPRLYVIIDESLESVYGCVQGGHAVAQYLLENPDSEWKNNYLIYLKDKLERLVVKLQILGIRYTEFREPDLGGKLTAIAVLGNQKVFQKLKLMGR